jgi:hypothetical protein
MNSRRIILGLSQAEREANRKLTLSFSAYEADTYRLMSLKDTQIADLRTENKKFAGQRNSLLAIVITTGSAVILFVAFMVFSALKMPF